MRRFFKGQWRRDAAAELNRQPPRQRQAPTFLPMNKMAAASIHHSCEKRWQCLSGAFETAATAQESRAILQSTIKVCRMLPVGLTAEAAAKALRLETALPAAARWKLEGR